MSSRIRFAGFRAALAGSLLALVALLQACSSGSGGSDVGAHAAVAPTARIQVLNGAANRAFREGSEVLLTGKASEDADGPPIAWSWKQTAGPAVRLLETNRTTVKFTAPPVASSTVLRFELTVTDSTGNKGSAATDITVLPARDSDKFLTLDVARGASFDTFEVVAALASGASTRDLPRPFTLTTNDPALSARLATAIYRPSAPGLSLGNAPGRISFEYTGEDGLNARKTFYFQPEGKSYLLKVEAAIANVHLGGIELGPEYSEVLPLLLVLLVLALRPPREALEDVE